MSFYKKPLFYITILFLLIVIAGVSALFWPSSHTPAVLRVLTGDVQMDIGNGYVPATNTTLDAHDKIRTGDDGTAMVVLYDSIIIRILPDTEIAIADLSKEKQDIQQQTGSVWTKVAHLGGVEQYSIQTPTTTATVRGTSLRTTASQDAYELLVAQGNVTLTQPFMDCVPDPKCGVHVLAHQKIALNSENMSAYTAPIKNLSAEDLAAMREELKFELAELRQLRLQEVYKNTKTVALAKRMFNVTDADIARFFIDIDEGRRSEDDIRSNIKIITPSVQTVFAYDAEIKKTLEAIAKE